MDPDIHGITDQNMGSPDDGEPCGGDDAGVDVVQSGVTHLPGRM
jgi:hypothetical protein